MKLPARKYKLRHMLGVVFSANPFYCSLRAFVTITGGVMPALTVTCAALFIRRAVDAAGGGSMTGVWWPLAGLIGSIAWDWVMTAFCKLLVIRANNRLHAEFVTAFALRRAQLAYHHVENNDTYDLIQRVTDGPEDQFMGAFDTLCWLTNMVLNIFSVAALLLVHMPVVALLILGIGVPVMFFAVKTGKINYDGFRETNKPMRRLGYLGEVLTQRDAAMERAMFGYSEKVNRRFLDVFDQARGIFLRVTRRLMIRNLGSQMLTVGMSLAIALLMLGGVLRKPETFPLYVSLVGTVFTLVQYTAWRIPGCMGHLSQFSEYLKDFTTFCGLEQVEDATVMPLYPEQAPQEIVFDDVWFRYPQTELDVLCGVNFTLCANRHYALVGANGTGKSTIVKLLLGLYTNYTGRILVDGRELRDLPPAERKGLFAAVHQDFARYGVTLRENIALGAGVDLEQTTPDTNHAETLLGMEDIAAELPRGYDTVLGKNIENGQELSGGQWQRVALARAMASPAPVIMLDEPTAALDPLSESAVYQSFGEISQNRTTLFISHRLGSTQLADEIIVLDAGVVCQQGSHQQLMAQGGLYAEMYDAQRSWYQ